MKEPIFKYENETTICEVIDNMGRVFKGESHCHPDDKEELLLNLVRELQLRVHIEMI